MSQEQALKSDVFSVEHQSEIKMYIGKGWGCLKIDFKKRGALGGVIIFTIVLGDRRGSQFSRPVRSTRNVTTLVQVKNWVL